MSGLTVVAGGWLRVLGTSGPVSLQDPFGDGAPPEGVTVLGHDAAGGFFARRDTPNVEYLAPDTLEWEDLDVTGAEWAAWTRDDVGVAEFYADVWTDELRALAAALAPDQGIAISPPLWAEADGDAARTHAAAPIGALWATALSFAAQLADLPEGADVDV